MSLWSSRVPDRSERIRTFLADSNVDKDLVKSSYWALIDQNEKCASKISRWLFLGIVAVALFELFDRKLINHASFSFFALDRITFLPYVLPPFVALSFLNVMALIIEGSVYTDVARELAIQAFPEFQKTGISDLFCGHAGVFGVELPAGLVARRPRLAMDVFFYLQALVAPILVLAFEAYAYVQLFNHFGLSNTPTYLSLAGSVGLLILTVPFIMGFAD